MNRLFGVSMDAEAVTKPVRISGVFDSTEWGHQIE